MPKTAHKVVVIGHRNPDTDSICSAIAYAELKNKTSPLVCEARRAGRMNQETEFVLKRFGVAPPRMCTDVNPKIRDVDYREMPGIPGSTSLRKAWEIMRDQQIDTLPITSADNELEGIITVKDIATANMDVFDTGVLATSRTTYKNILETLGGTMVVGNENAVCTTGHIKIGTATPEMLENNVEKGDIVILTNRYESQLCAIEKEASLLIICNGAKAGRTIQRPQRKVNDEYDVIMNNILMMFLNNTYLNIQLKEKQYRQQNAELTALQLQINPHFLYNTLQTLDMEARKLNDDGRISAVVGYVSDILKYSLTNPQKSVSLREELDYLKKYVEVQHYRFGDRFIIYYEVDDDVMDAEVFRLMLQPVVENSLLHALRGNERGYMKVRARRIGDKVNLRVIDNGDGMTREELEALRKRIADRNSRSIGLTNLDRRLRLRYPEETGLRICSIKNLGTSVSFCIPYKKYTPDAPQTGKTE